MKQIKLFIGSAFVLATVSAFAFQPTHTLALGDYRSFDDGTGCSNTASVLNQPACTGGTKICKVGNTTYYQNQNCQNPLMKP